MLASDWHVRQHASLPHDYYNSVFYILAIVAVSQNRNTYLTSQMRSNELTAM